MEQTDPHDKMGRPRPPPGPQFIMLPYKRESYAPAKIASTDIVHANVWP